MLFTIAAAGLAALSTVPDVDEPSEGVEMLWSFVSSEGAYYQIERKDAEQKIPSGSATVWVQADHSKDRSVAYRRSLRRVTFDCAGSYQVTAFVSYMPDGSVRDRWDRFGKTEPVGRGSFAESLERALCQRTAAGRTR